MNTLLLDAALGTQLAINGEELPDWKKSLWSAHALIYKPEAILKIHLDNIEAGAEVITTSNYYATPIILAKDSGKHDYKELAKRALDLADEKWNGDILIRASNNIYNQSLVAYMIEVYGEKKATEWVRGLVKNMARSPQGNDRAQILGVAAKEGKIAVANTYYHSLMMSGKKGTEQKKAAEKVSPIFPGQNSKGTHINISGAGLLKHSPNKKNAIKLLEFFLSDKAQKHIVNNTFEYPISKNVNPHPLVSRMGTNFKENNSISISSYFKWQSKAYKIMLENGWK